MRAVSSIFAFGDEHQALYWSVQTYREEGESAWNSGMAARRYSGLHNVHDTVLNQHIGWSPKGRLVDTKIHTKLKKKNPGFATHLYWRIEIVVACTLGT